MDEDEAIEQMYRQHPLIAFSLYTDIQADTIRNLGDEIVSSLEKIISVDEAKKTRMVDGVGFNEVFSKVWLWVVGAFEVVRTMHGAKQCFSDRLNAEMKPLKDRLALIRVPFAKQRLAGQHTPVQGELSVHLVTFTPPDFIYEIDGKKFSTRDLIAEFERVFAGISRPDVLADYRTIFNASAGST